jgi:hypothetical protein
MSTNLSVIGLRDENDPSHIKMVKAKEALDAAEIEWPKEVYDYFDGSRYSDTPLEVKIPNNEWGNDYVSGYEILVSEIPKNVKKIRVYLS